MLKSQLHAAGSAAGKDYRRKQKRRPMESTPVGSSLGALPLGAAVKPTYLTQCGTTVVGAAEPQLAIWLLHHAVPTPAAHWAIATRRPWPWSRRRWTRSSLRWRRWRRSSLRWHWWARRTTRSRSQRRQRQIVVCQRLRRWQAGCRGIGIGVGRLGTARVRASQLS